MNVIVVIRILSSVLQHCEFRYYCLDSFFKKINGKVYQYINIIVAKMRIVSRFLQYGNKFFFEWRSLKAVHLDFIHKRRLIYSIGVFHAIQIHPIPGFQFLYALHQSNTSPARIVSIVRTFSSTLSIYKLTPTPHSIHILNSTHVFPFTIDDGVPYHFSPDL